MYQFTGTITNEFRPEPGVNLVIKAVGEKFIQQPQHINNIDFKQDGSTFTLILSPSSEGTASCSVNVEITGGTHKVTTSPDSWTVELTASDASTPCNAAITVAVNEEE
ncbi:MAG: hypothetical protein ACM3SY_14050 [Candidatus Omnitrophota bacterium]